MPRIAKTPQARRYLKEIWRYIARDNPAAADKTVRKINETCVNLSHYPKLGHHRDDLPPDLLFFPSEKYLILFKSIPDGILIVRILHSARSLLDLL